MSELKISSAAVTHQGIKRKNNEDNFFLNGAYKADPLCNEIRISDEEQKPQYVYAVCDGVGGHDSGEIAAFNAVKAIGEYFANVGNDLLYSSLFANEMVCKTSEQIPNSNMGATMVAISLEPIKLEETSGLSDRLGEVSDADQSNCNQKVESSDSKQSNCNQKENFTLNVCNVGDSRAYRYRGGELTQLSKDHSRAQMLIDAGIMTEEEASKIKSHAITQCLGFDLESHIINPYFNNYGLIHSGDMYLLCSDGLTDMLENAEICQIMRENAHNPANYICELLLNKSLENGGKDNITIIIVKVEELAS